MEDIYNDLNTYLKGSTKSGINETIAQFMLLHLNDIPQMRASDIGEKCHTSTPSVIRFCRELGYEGFADFKDAVVDYCQNVEERVLVPHIPFRLLGSEKEYRKAVARWTRMMQDYALRGVLSLDRQKLMKLALDILNYRHVYIFGVGMSGIVAEQIRIHLARSGKIIITSAIPRMDMPLSENRADTLGIVISQHGRLLKSTSDGSRLFPYLAQNCGRTWMITQEAERKRFPVDEQLHIQGSSDFEVEYHTMLYFAEILGEYCRELMEEA